MSRFIVALLTSLALTMLANPSFGDEPTPAASGGAVSASVPASAEGAYASEVPERDIVQDTDRPALASDSEETTIPVAEELDFVEGNLFRRPYEESLKAVASVDYFGTRYVDCEHYPLEVRTARPDRISLLLKVDASSKFEGGKAGKRVSLRGTPQGLGIEQERALLATFNFDSLVIELEKKRQVIKPLGMQKLPGMLTWKLEVDGLDGFRQVEYVDSHYGDIVRSVIINAQGEPLLEVAPHDYRVVEGIRVPFAVDYKSPAGTLLASDRFERVKVKRAQS